MKTLTSLKGVHDPYSRKILANIVRKDVVGILDRTPRRLRELTRGLSRAELIRRPSKTGWSIAELACHLSDTELVLGFRIRMALSQSGRELQAIDQGRWASSLRYRTANLKEKLLLFAGLRRDLMKILRSLSREEWRRYGRHEERGKETVERMAQMYAGHDLNHLAQIRMIRRSLKLQR